MKKIIKTFMVCIVAFTTFCLPMTAIYAATYSVGSNKSSVQPGEKFSVTISLNGSGMFFFSASNATLNTTSTYCDSSCTVEATAGSSGTATVNIKPGAEGTPDEVTGFDDPTAITEVKSISIAVKAPVQPSNPSTPGNNGGSGTNNGSNNGNTQTPNQPTDPVKKNTDSSLSSLAVSAGKLSPEFASGTTAYTLDLEESVTSLEVTATATDAKASVTGTGKIELKTGENSIKIDCKAEDGTVTTYTIQAIVNETPATKVDFNGNDLGVLQNVKDAPALTKDFSETTVKVNGVDVPGWKNEALNLTLVYLKDADGKNFYIFDEASQKVTSIYKPMALLGLNLIQIDVPADLQKRAGMTFTTVEIDGQKVPGWTFDDKAFENYSLIYMMDEGGNKQYYQYEKTGNRLQLFSGAAATTQKDYEALVEKEQTLMYIIYGLGAGCVAALGLAGFFFFRRKPAGKGPRRVDIEKENYEDRFHLEKENQKESE